MHQALIKNRKGFTLIEILVVVVIIAILAAISVPIYIEYVRGARAADAQSQIGAIYNAAKMFYQDRDRAPQDVQELEDFGYLTLDESARRMWQFSIAWPDFIEGSSTDEMPGGAGKNITYNILEGTFQGYGLPNDGNDDSGDF